jgi:putative hemolysin
MLTEILIVAALIVLNGFFAMSEIAIVSTRRGRIKQLAEEGHTGAKAALTLIDDPTGFLSTVQIGITLIGTIAGAYGGVTIGQKLGVILDAFPLIAPYGAPIAMSFVVFVIAALSLIVGELVPKRMGLAYAEPLALALAPALRVIAISTFPLVWLLRHTSDFVLRLMRLSGDRRDEVTEEEVKSMIAEGTESGVFDAAEKEMLEGVLRLSDRSVRAIMTPRTEILWLDPEEPEDVIRDQIRTGGRSRFLVAKGGIEQVLGYVQAKDILDRFLEGKPFDLMAVLQDALVVHERTTVLRLVEMFRKDGSQLAIVADEYGSVEGIVTMTDVMLAIARDLPQIEDDEDDSTAVQRADGSWLVDGMMPVDQVEKRLGLKHMKDEDDDFDTLAGFILSLIGHVPAAGDTVDWNGTHFEVIDMDGRRIDKLLVTPAAPSPTDG